MTSPAWIIDVVILVRYEGKICGSMITNHIQAQKCRWRRHFTVLGSKSQGRSWGRIAHHGPILRSKQNSEASLGAIINYQGDIVLFRDLEGVQSSQHTTPPTLRQPQLPGNSELFASKWHFYLFRCPSQKLLIWHQILWTACLNFLMAASISVPEPSPGYFLQLSLFPP